MARAAPVPPAIHDTTFRRGGHASPRTAATTENIAAEKIPVSTFVAYPNPAKDVLHIKSENKAIMVLSDASGKTVLTQNINGNADINIHDLQAGIYFLKSQITGEEKKILIER